MTGAQRPPTSRITGLFLGLLALAPASHPFHEQGVASCGSCHVMHDSQDGLAVATRPDGTPGLLRAETPSDVCLLCHAEDAGSVLGGDLLNPPPELGAGNFVFLLAANLNDGPDGAVAIIPGDAAGHNILAPGHGLSTDTRYVTSPGGSFPASEMGCTSCHDPHGNDSFRLLHGTGAVQSGLVFFSSPAPDAQGVELGSDGETSDNHTAYRRGVSDWCGNCHGDYRRHASFEHPSDEPLGVEISSQYNAFNGDNDPTGGTQAMSYLAAVPFEDLAADAASRTGPSAASRVTCLSCHRAHASSAPAAGRWDFNVARLGEDGVVSGSHPIPNPYPTSPDQGSLCAKCHEGGAPN